MSSTRGFQNIYQITKAIHKLYHEFGPKHLKSYPSTFAVEPSFRDIERNDVIGTQLLARSMAEHYRLPVTTVIVTGSGADRDHVFVF